VVYHREILGAARAFVKSARPLIAFAQEHGEVDFAGRLPVIGEHSGGFAAVLNSLADALLGRPFHSLPRGAGKSGGWVVTTYQGSIEMIDGIEAQMYFSWVDDGVMQMGRWSEWDLSG
jgi:hypothetical protein